MAEPPTYWYGANTRDAYGLSEQFKANCVTLQPGDHTRGLTWMATVSIVPDHSVMIIPPRGDIPLPCTACQSYSVGFAPGVAQAIETSLGPYWKDHQSFVPRPVIFAALERLRGQRNLTAFAMGDKIYFGKKREAAAPSEPMPGDQPRTGGAEPETIV